VHEPGLIPKRDGSLDPWVFNSNPVTETFFLNIKRRSLPSKTLGLTTYFQLI
jgi:hypothetical protein